MSADPGAVPRSFGGSVVFVGRRVPATIALVVVILACGVIWRGLWTPFEDSAAYDVFAYGLPALEAGRWWTPVTGVFFVAQPLVYLPTLLLLTGLAVLEWRRGWKVATAYFWIGSLFAVFATALFVWLASLIPLWRWAQEQAAALDVGSSGGSFACLAAVAGLLASPWRVRAWVVLLAVVIVGALYLGTLADLEHLAAVLLILGVDRSLHVRRTTMRDQRLIAFIAVLAFAATEVIATLVSTDGPFGVRDRVSEPLWSTTLDVVVVLLIANGLRRARRWAWITAIVLLSLNVLASVLVAAIVIVIRVTGGEQDLTGLLTTEVAGGVIALVVLVYLIATRGAFRWHRRGSVGGAPAATVDDVKGMLHESGGGTLSWMTTWDGNQYLRTGSGIVAFQRRANVAIALGDPLGESGGRARSVGEFVQLCERAALIPCFFSAGTATRDAVPDTWRRLVVADDTIVDLPGLEFTGKRWASVRTSLNRAGREDVTFRMTRLRDEPWGVRAQLQAISAMWVGDKGLPEMGFTLGTLDEAEDPEVRMALAVSARGDVEGFLSWLPVYGEDGGGVRGWTLDLMRRREGGFPAVMEFLIGMSAAHFRDEGAEIMSLSGAPLAHDYPPDAGMIADLSDRLAEMLEPVYGFRSLHRFKEKFHPRYETMYLLFRDEADLPRIAAGLTRAFLPDATLRQFAGAGLDLVRHDE